MFEGRWRQFLLLLAGTLQAIAILRFAGDKSALWDDQALYQHGGWYITKGAVPYRDFFDVKPPLAFEFPAIFATLAGDNMAAFHLVMTLVTGIAMVASVLLLATLTYSLTDNYWSALTSGLVVLSFPATYYIPAHGYLPDVLVLFSGLLAIYLFNKQFHFTSGSVAAIAAGFWQIGVVFPVIILALAFSRGKSVLLRSVAGMTIVTILVVAPFVAWDALEPLFVEVVLIPVTTGGGELSLSTFGRMVYMYGYSFPLVVVGLLGGLYTQHDTGGKRWVQFFILYVLIVVLLLNFQARPDLLLPLAAAGIGLGLVVDNLAPSRKNTIIVVVFLILIINPLHFGGIEVVTGPLTTTDDTDSVEKYLSAPVDALADTLNNDFGGQPETHNVDSPYYPPDMQKIYWEQIQPTSCHYRFAGHEIRWIKKTGKSPTATTCGNFQGGIF